VIAERASISSGVIATYTVSFAALAAKWRNATSKMTKNSPQATAPALAKQRCKHLALLNGVEH